METQLAILVVSFLVLLVMDVPIAVGIGISALLTIASLGDVPANYVVAQRMSTGTGPCAACGGINTEKLISDRQD